MSQTKNYRLALMGILSAIIIVQNFVPFLGYIPLQPFNPTIIHITVIIGAVYLGPWMGATLGGVWGVVCLLRAFVFPTSPIDPIVFTNPLVSLLPRILVGLLAGLLYLWLRKLNVPVIARFATCGVVGSLVNTVLVLGSIYLLYQEPYAAFYQMAASDLLPAMLGIVGTNGVAEAIAAAVITPLIAGPLHKVKPID